MAANALPIKAATSARAQQQTDRFSAVVDLNLQEEIDRLKDSEGQPRQYSADTTQELLKAIDLLWQLQRVAYEDASRVGYEKLRNAKFYLDGLLKKHLDGAQL